MPRVYKLLANYINIWIQGTIVHRANTNENRNEKYRNSNAPGHNLNVYLTNKLGKIAQRILPEQRRYQPNPTQTIPH